MSDRIATQPAPASNETVAFPAGVESVIGGRYRILRKLGEGGFAYVFEASHVELPDLHYAIKVLRGEHAGEAEVLKKFRHEAVLLSGLACPQTVRVIDFGITASGSPYFVMEFVKGVTLESLLTREKRLRPTDVARLAMDVLESLDEAHNARIVHRDIKPANILVVPGFAGSHPRAKVLDFGIAKVLAGQGEGLAAANQTVGDFVFCTPLYAPAEVLRRDPKPQSDLYSLGHVMAELLDGQAPFVADVPVMSAYRHLSGEPIALGPAAEASGLAAIIRRATAHAVEERYPTAAAMLQELRAATQKLVSAAGNEQVLAVGADALAMGESAEQLSAQEFDASLPVETDVWPAGALTGGNAANHTPTQALGGETAPQPKLPAALRQEPEPAPAPKPAAQGPRAEVSGPVTAAVVGELQAGNRKLKFVAGAVVFAVLAAAAALVTVLRSGGEAPVQAERPEGSAAAEPAAPAPAVAAAPAPAPASNEGSAQVGDGAAAPAAEPTPAVVAPAVAPAASSSRPRAAKAPAAAPAPAPAVEAPPAPKPEPTPEPVVAPEVKQPATAPEPAAAEPPKKKLSGRSSIFIPTAPK